MNIYYIKSYITLHNKVRILEKQKERRRQHQIVSFLFNFHFDAET